MCDHCGWEEAIDVCENFEESVDEIYAKFPNLTPEIEHDLEIMLIWVQELQEKLETTPHLRVTQGRSLGTKRLRVAAMLQSQDV